MSHSLEDGRVALIDWQMMSLAPVAVELGWLLVSNSSSLRRTPDEVMAAYRAAAVRAATGSLPMGNSWLIGPSAGPAMERAPDRLPPRGLDATIGDWDAQLRPDLDRRAAAARLAQGLGRGGRRSSCRLGRRGRGRPRLVVRRVRSMPPARRL